MSPFRNFFYITGLALVLSAAPSDASPATGGLAFPLLFEADIGRIELRQPLVSDWPGLRHIEGSLPYEFTPADGVAGQGRARFSADTLVDFGQRQVILRNPELAGVTGPDAAGELLRAALTQRPVTISLDALLQALPDDFELPQQAVAGPQLNFQPPRIVVSFKPMRLMLIDGPPARVDIEATGLEFVVNTDWDIFHDTRSGKWYILDDGHWITNTLLSSGDWLNTTELPRDFLTLQVSSEWPRVAAAMPPRKTDRRPLPLTISYEPTELVLIDGEARLEAIGDSGLQYVSNTDSDLFLLDGYYYYLASGRWFRSKNFNRQWSSVRSLPSAFAGIPEDHPRGRVLAAVPGTRAARLAMIEAAIPRLARVQAGAGGRLQIPYMGEPSFVEIEGTGLRRAENTPYQVIMHNNFYYLCHEGAWYSSSKPQGPWAAAREVPEAIYTIPATDPAYNVTFVRLESFDDSSGQAAYVSTGGYYSYHYTGSTMVYGTGWYYPGFYNQHAYWRYPPTYGYGGYGGPYAYGRAYPYYPHNRSVTLDVERDDADWEWGPDGTKRRVYDYGPRNYVGEIYTMPDSDNFKGDAR